MLCILGPPGPEFRGPPQDHFGDPRDRRMPFDPRDPRNRDPPRGNYVHAKLCSYKVKCFKTTMYTECTHLVQGPEWSIALSWFFH